MKVYAMLQNGMGGIDWGPGLDLAIALFQIEDVEALCNDLLTIKWHKPAKPED